MSSPSGHGPPGRHGEHPRQQFFVEGNGVPAMMMDLLIALVITIVAVALGVTVHPVLFFLIAFAVIWLIVRHRSGGRRSAL